MAVHDVFHLDPRGVEAAQGFLVVLARAFEADDVDDYLGGCGSAHGDDVRGPVVVRARGGPVVRVSRDDANAGLEVVDGPGLGQEGDSRAELGDEHVETAAGGVVELDAAVEAEGGQNRGGSPTTTRG